MATAYYLWLPSEYVMLGLPNSMLLLDSRRLTRVSRPSGKYARHMSVPILPGLRCHMSRLGIWVARY